MAEELESLLSVTTGPGGESVTIHADRAGLEELRSVVDRLISKLDSGQCDDDHLRSRAWAGWELTDTMLDQERGAGHKAVHHVKVYAWTNEWRRKHGL